MRNTTSEKIIWQHFIDGLLRYDEAFYNLLVAGCSEQTAKNILNSSSAPLPCNVVEIDVAGVVSICCAHCGEELLPNEHVHEHVCDDQLNVLTMSYEPLFALAHTAIHNRN